MRSLSLPKRPHYASVPYPILFSEPMVSEPAEAPALRIRPIPIPFSEPMASEPAEAPSIHVKEIS